MHNNQKGFGHVGTIIIIVVVAFVGFSGCFVWSKSNPDDNKNTETSSENRNTNASPESDATSEPNDEVALSSWGLKFTPPITMEDLIN